MRYYLSQNWFSNVECVVFTNRYRSYVNLSGYAFSEYVQLGLRWVGCASTYRSLALPDLVLVGGHRVSRVVYWRWSHRACRRRRARNRKEESVRDRRYLARTRIASPWFWLGA